MDIQVIGYYHSFRKNKHQIPRQGAYAADEKGCLHICEDLYNRGEILKGLESFEKVWVIFLFHKNTTWKPTLLPPGRKKGKLGVFATRSPHRPNPIGLTCVTLNKIEKNQIHISGADLLDKTPIIDIKPYLSFADAFPNAKMGWHMGQDHRPYKINLGQDFTIKITWLLTKHDEDISSAVITQLEYDPCNQKRKRIKASTQEDNYILSYRTWKIHYYVDHKSQVIQVKDINSSYTDEELNEAVDPYNDKNIHKEFRERFKLKKEP